MVVSILEWALFDLFLRTDYFLGPSQFLIHQIFCFATEVYLTLYYPLVWLWNSKKANWVGWGQTQKKKKQTKFHYVRKPDPLEKFNPKIKRECFTYFRRTPISVAPILCTINEYIILEPESGPVITMSLPLDYWETLDIEM